MSGDLKVLNDILLSMIDPAREDQEQQLPGLQKGFHISECVVKRRSIRDWWVPVNRAKQASQGL